MIGSVLHQHHRFQPTAAKHKYYTSLKISLMPRDVAECLLCWNTSPVCKFFCKTYNHYYRSLRMIIQYIFFSHCLFPVKAASHLSGWQTSTLYTFCTAWLAKIAICIYILYICKLSCLQNLDTAVSILIKVEKDFYCHSITGIIQCSYGYISFVGIQTCWYSFNAKLLCFFACYLT